MKFRTSVAAATIACVLAAALQGCSSGPPETSAPVTDSPVSVAASPTPEPLPSSPPSAPPSPSESSPDRERIQSEACAALADAPSWDDWVMFEPDGTAFVAREHLWMAKAAERSYQRAFDIVYPAITGAPPNDDAVVAKIFMEASERLNAAMQLRFDAKRWLRDRSTQDWRSWMYSFGHLIRVVELSPSGCSD